jgi:hypothetical protein
MKKALIISFFFFSINCYSQSTKNDSIELKKVYIQLDLTGFLSVESKKDQNPYQNNFERYQYSPSINFTIGYSYLKDPSKKLKKSVQLNLLYYTSTSLIDGFKKIKIYSFNNDHSTYFAIAPELKLLFNKKAKNNGIYGTIGGGYSQLKVFGYESALYEKKIGWNLIGSVGYQLPLKKRIYFDFNLGITSFFTCRSYNYKLNQGPLTEEEHYKWVQKNYPDKGIEDVSFVNSNTVRYNYKMAGLLSYKLIPRGGIALGIKF